MPARRVKTCPTIPELGAIFKEGGEQLARDMVSAKEVLRHLRWIVASSDIELALQMLNDVIGSLMFDVPLIEKFQWMQLKGESMTATAEKCRSESGSSIAASTSSHMRVGSVHSEPLPARAAYTASALVELPPRELQGESTTVSASSSYRRFRSTPRRGSNMACEFEDGSASDTSRQGSKSSSFSATSTSSDRRVVPQWAEALTARLSGAPARDLNGDSDENITDMRACVSASSNSSNGRIARLQQHADNWPARSSGGPAWDLSGDNDESSTDIIDRSSTEGASFASTSSNSSNMWAAAPGAKEKPSRSRARSVTSWFQAACTRSTFASPKTTPSVCPPGGDVRNYYDYWVRSIADAAGSQVSSQSCPGSFAASGDLAWSSPASSSRQVRGGDAFDGIL
eukprot:TRINITY_DN47166_c0_g1_i2.p1 TRINITY_DN47166_c0_g1~~TRINITY_DN47166_c0_g1_i2.p1  ORF type:complete len:419 (-),score=25.28 TRINITY_DN47166_c0_g1_i2:208-1404(-)